MGKVKRFFSSMGNTGVSIYQFIPESMEVEVVKMQKELNSNTLL
jgi:hypothetical protein